MSIGAGILIGTALSLGGVLLLVLWYARTWKDGGE